jgi:para-aminobenzoate synthetase/4-amino-4-deoxychorismate lyase
VLARRTATFELIETMRWSSDDGFHLLHRHLERLGSSARYFDIPLDPAEVRAALRAAVAGITGARRVRLLLSRAGEIRVEVSDLPPPGKVVAAIDYHPVDSADVFLYHKTTNRSLYDQARSRHPEAEDVVLVNEDGEITETTIANIAALIEGVWLTPPVECGLLPGTYRAELLASGRLTEARLSPLDLKTASSVARLNALRGWHEITLI